jgi:hypothetical protein
MSHIPQPPKPDTRVLHRVYRLWEATHRFSSSEVTTTWIAHKLVRFDGGPMLDSGELAPALRFLGYTPVRRRAGQRRVNAWLLPGRPPSPRGRPYQGEQRGAPETWPTSRRWRTVVPFRAPPAA